MDKKTLLNLLGPFVRGEVPKDQRWHDATRKIAEEIPQNEVENAIGLLEGMYHNPLDPESTPDRGVPGAHGVYSNLLLRRRRRRGRGEERE